MVTLSKIREAAENTNPVTVEIDFTVEGVIEGQEVLIEGKAETCLFEGQPCVLSVEFDDATAERIAEITGGNGFENVQVENYVFEELAAKGSSFPKYAKEILVDRLR